MSFAYTFPWWAAPIVLAAAAALAWLGYRRLIVPLSPPQRAALVSLRTAALAALALLLFRPSGFRVPDGPRDAIVPVLIDTSRSMAIADAPGEATRLEQAIRLVHERLEPALAGRAVAELFTFGAALEPGLQENVRAEGGATDVGGALAALRERYRGRPVAAAVVLSDGGDTSRTQEYGGEGGPPVFTVGVGDLALRDREITGIAAGDPRLGDASVDLRVSAVSRGFAREPVTVRLAAGGATLDSRTLTPAADGSPVELVFTAAPDASAPTVYSVEIPAADGELVTGNNHRDVLVAPAGRQRRLLAIEGAPGFEHSFQARAWARDAALEVDAVVRKGQNDEGQNTFFVQAAADRSAALLGGFPAAREDLYAYDAVVLSNIEADFFTRAQLLMLADFVAVRGGGLLLTGGRSFAARGYAGTALAPVLPVQLTDRQGALALPGVDARGSTGQLLLTPEGAGHPMLRLGAGAEETRARWAEMPPLAAASPLGAPRPGASLLAVTPAEGGGVQPLIAVQPYGQGRSMIFAGEASWRWRMLLPASDGRYERFWRQTARWLAGASPDPVAADVPASAAPEAVVTIDAIARTRAFEPVPDATWTGILTGPGGGEQPLTLRPVDAPNGRFAATVRPNEAGVYRVRLEARDGDLPLGAVDRWFLVGGADAELADPRLNEALLQRVARATGGRYVPAADLDEILEDLRAASPPAAPPERYDLWQRPWVFGVIVALLAAEWILRRRWGLR